ncbi:MAG: YggT family protein [Leptospirales bacterium]
MRSGRRSSTLWHSWWHVLVPCPIPISKEADILLVDRLLTLYSWIIIIRALISWVSPDPENPLMRVLHGITEPVLAPLRRLVPPEKLAGMDVSPLIAIFLIQVIQHFLY